MKRTNPHLICGAADALPFRAGAFSAVVCVRPASVAPVLLAELRRVLEVGGILVLDTRTGGAKRMRNDMGDLLRQAGFEIVAQRRVLGRELIVHARATLPTPEP